MTFAEAPIIACVAPECVNPAGPEGFCPDHDGLAAEAREQAKRILQMQDDIAKITATHRLARRIVMRDVQSRAAKRTEARRTKRKISAASKRRNR